MPVKLQQAKSATGFPPTPSILVKISELSGFPPEIMVPYNTQHTPHCHTCGGTQHTATVAVAMPKQLADPIFTDREACRPTLLPREKIVKSDRKFGPYQSTQKLVPDPP